MAGQNSHQRPRAAGRFTQFFVTLFQACVCCGPNSNQENATPAYGEDVLMRSESAHEKHACSKNRKTTGLLSRLKKRKNKVNTIEVCSTSSVDDATYDDFNINASNDQFYQEYDINGNEAESGDIDSFCEPTFLTVTAEVHEPPEFILPGCTTDGEELLVNESLICHMTCDDDDEEALLDLEADLLVREAFEEASYCDEEIFAW